MPFLNTHTSRDSTVDYVLKTIINWVNDGTYKSGDKLPTESELCRLTGISRGPVREGIKILSALGLVESRQGSGNYVTDGYIQPMVEPLLNKLKNSAWDVDQLMEFRGTLESAVMEAVVRNAGEEDLDLLSQTNRRMREAEDKGEDWKAVSALDIKFHQQLAKSTKNILLELLYIHMLDFFALDVDRMYEESDAMGSVSYVLHEKLIESVAKRDLEAAQKILEAAMKNHEKAGSALEALDSREIG